MTSSVVFWRGSPAEVFVWFLQLLGLTPPQALHGHCIPCCFFPRLTVLASSNDLSLNLIARRWLLWRCRTLALRGEPRDNVVRLHNSWQAQRNGGWPYVMISSHPRLAFPGGRLRNLDIQYITYNTIQCILCTHYMIICILIWVRSSLHAIHLRQQLLASMTQKLRKKTRKRKERGRDFSVWLKSEGLLSI